LRQQSAQPAQPAQPAQHSAAPRVARTTQAQQGLFGVQVAFESVLDLALGAKPAHAATTRSKSKPEHAHPEEPVRPLTSEVVRLHRRAQAGAAQPARRPSRVEVRGKATVSQPAPVAPAPAVDPHKPRPKKPSPVSASLRDNILEVTYHAFEGWLPDCLIDPTKAPGRSDAPDPFIHEFQARGHCA
jgi:hypothetical protein